MGASESGAGGGESLTTGTKAINAPFLESLRYFPCSPLIPSSCFVSSSHLTVFGRGGDWERSRGEREPNVHFGSGATRLIKQSRALFSPPF